jgi:tetratricopeptide (TPR) repeat protein
MNRGAAAAKSAKDANDFKDAVAEFEKATLSAPWMANAYYNLGVAQDKAGMYSNAVRSLKLYLVAAPNAPDTKNVEKLIDEIEYRQEKAAKESSPAAVAAKKQQTYEEWLRSLDGARFFGSYNVLNSYWESELTIRGSKLYWRTSCVRGEGCIAGWFVKCRAGEMQIIERQAKCIDEVAPASWNVVSDIFTIS